MILFVDDPMHRYSAYQVSTTQGLGGVNIHNDYSTPIAIMIEDKKTFIPSGMSYRYRGYYGSGIPYGEIVFTTNDTIVIDRYATDIHLHP